MNNTYLAHHGVKGMKWGIRHDLYEKANRDILKYKASGASAQDVAQYRQNRLDSARYRTARKAYAKSQSTGKRVAKFMLFGAAGAHTYNSIKMATNNRAYAAGAAFASKISNFVAPVAGGAATAVIADSYNKSRYLNSHKQSYK